MKIDNKKFLLGLQCPRCFWNSIYNPEEIETSEQIKQLMEHAKDVKLKALSIYNDCIDLSYLDCDTKVHCTITAIADRAKIYHGKIKIDELECTFDFLIPNNNNTWDIIDVSIVTDIKEEQISEVAFQRYVLKLSGININRCYSLHINNHYEKNGALNLDELLIKTDITESVDNVFTDIEAIINNLNQIKQATLAPELSATLYYNKPYPCDFSNECWSHLPEHNVSTLCKVQKRKVVELLNNGIENIIDVPDKKLSENQKI